MQADLYMDEIIEIADGVRGGRSRTSVRAAKLAIDARKWMVVRLMPKKYGGRHAGPGRDRRLGGQDLIRGA